MCTPCRHAWQVQSFARSNGWFKKLVKLAKAQTWQAEIAVVQNLMRNAVAKLGVALNLMVIGRSDSHHASLKVHTIPYVGPSGGMQPILPSIAHDLNSFDCS